ncbi:hypothetical protein H0H81_009952 [Sphagnurus paluster]|uniref:CCHC-type domain-containing protein n=1 Tax=Sphagnurus paluster TaxID=117069 RepID=A0A9P7FV58_9AGAR|nr:hypothetical protein H0H81_009952 [Sphagnurus paluster]
MDFLTRTRTVLTDKLRFFYYKKRLTIQLPNSPWTRLAPHQSVADLERDVEDRYLLPIVSTTSTVTSPSDTETGSTFSEEFSPPLTDYTLSTPATWPATPEDESPPTTLAPIPPTTPVPVPIPVPTPISDDFDMADLNAIEFTGKPEEGDPQDFMNRLEHLIIMKTGLKEAEKVRLLELSLKAKSPAAVWWTTLSITDKASFASVRSAFKVRWPIKAIMEKTTAEKQALLDVVVLKPSDLGKRVAPSLGAEEELTHIVWADKVERLAGDIPDTNNLLVSGARKALPKAIARIVGWKATTWKELCDAVRAILLEELMEQVEDEQDRARLAVGPTAPNTPSKALGNAFQNISLAPTQQQVPSMATYQNPRPRAAQRAPFTSYPDRPMHERLADVLSKALPLQPNNSDGLARYKLQLSVWESTYGQFGKTPSEKRPYPLTPGTSPVASGECWKCGHRAHFPANCSMPLVPAFEQKWRSIAGSIRNKAETAGTPAVNVHTVSIESDEVQTYDADELAHLMQLVNQGKEGGPLM